MTTTPSVTKGIIIPYFPSTRSKGPEVMFEFNPSTVNISFNPTYIFNTAPVSSASFAQYGNSQPIEIEFELFLRHYKHAGQFKMYNVSKQLGIFRHFVEPPAESGDTPPFCQLLMGKTFSWLNRTLIGVITDMEVSILRQERDLSPMEAKVRINFKESKAISIAGAE